MAAAHNKPLQGSYYILQFDKEVENKSSRSLIYQAPKHQKILRGTLLESVSPSAQWQDPKRGRGNGKSIKLRRLASAQDIQMDVECFSSEVARITKDEMELLSAISSDHDRFQTYNEPNHLTFAHALRENSRVNVEVKCDTMKQTVSGFVRYIGPLPGERGKQFGIELQDNPGQGTSDGLFGRERFFQCKKDSAVFVPVSKLKFNKDPPVVPQVEMQSQNATQPRQSFIESDLKKDMEVYVSTKKGSKEEYVKGKIIYIGKPTGEVITYVGVELEKPRTTPWDGTFKSHRLCVPKNRWYSELVPINDIVPAEFLEGQDSCCSSSQPSGAVQPKKGSVKRAHSVNSNAKNTRSKPGPKPGAKPGYAAKKDSNDSQSKGTSRLHSLTGDVTHANSNYPLKTITGRNIYTELKPLAGSNEGGGRGQDINLKVQEQLFDTAKKNKDAGQSSNNSKGFRKFSKEFMSKLQSFGGNKERSTLQADLPPLGPELIEEICSEVDQNWGLLAHNLGIEHSRIEKISGKSPSSYDRVLSTLVHWWKEVHKQNQAIQALAYALSQLKLEKLAGRVLIAISESKMDDELMDIIAERTYSRWKGLATELGLENETIEQIEGSCTLYKDKARRMLDVWDKEISIGCEKLSLLVRACRHSGNGELANELEQGLDTDTLERISRMVDESKWYQFGQALGFSTEYLKALANACYIVKLRVYTMLGTWRNNQPFSSDKILAISSALEHCGLSQLAWEICRGLDEDLLNDLAYKLQKDWRMIGTRLHIPNPELSKLATNYTNTAKQAHQVLVMWRKRQHATCDLLGELAKVLRETQHKETADWLVQGIHDEILDKVASLIADEWEMLGEHLGFEKADIAAIKDANKLEAQRIYKMLCQWRYRQSYKTDRVRALVAGLTQCGLQDVADAVLDMIGRKETTADVATKPKSTTEVTRAQLMRIAKEMSTRWQLLASDLNVERKEIISITDKALQPEDQCTQMLLRWKANLPAGYDAKKDLIHALDNCSRHDLVVDVLGPRAGLKNDFSEISIPPPQIPKEQPSVNEDHLLEIAAEIGARWKIMARDLGFSGAEIVDIELRAPNGADQCYCMLQNWKEKLSPGHDGRQELSRALRKCGHKDMISKLWNSPIESNWDSGHFDAPSSSEESKGTISELSANVTEEVDKGMMLSVAAAVEFTALAKALQLTREDVDYIQVQYPRGDQRRFQALDAWARRGTGGRRSVSELLQVMQAMDRPDMVKYLTSAAHPRSGAQSSSGLSDVKTDCEAMKQNIPKLWDNKDSTQEHHSSLTAKETTVKEHADIQFTSDVPISDNTYGLEVNSMVEITWKKEKLYGVMRWMGHNTKFGSMAGIELEDKLPAGTDGTLFGNRVFSCETGRALFVKLQTVRPDSRFPSQDETFSKRTRLTSQDFGGFESPTLKGYIHPPHILTKEFVGRQKGIQGDQNSCYLDTTLFSMYAYSNIFDDILHRQKTDRDLKEYEDVQTILRENIVNPLRSYGFVRADRVLRLRHYLDQLGTTKGLTSEEKDPEEFLHTFLQEVTKTEPFLHIRQHGSDNVEKSYHYQIFMEKNESYQLPSVEQLLHYSFLHSDLRLAKVPPCLIMQMPRFGKDYRMYNRILPSLHLDISDLLEGWPRICTVCGNLAELECRDCSGQLSEAGVTEAINSYCQDCSEAVHMTRKNHHVKILKIGDDVIARIHDARERGLNEQEIHEQILAPRKMMELFAVVCIETSHYVAFVKAGTGSDANWVFFDSMADREGDQQGYNIPEITHLPQFKDWVGNEALLKGMDDKELPPPLRRLLCDGYMCMYQDPAVVQEHKRDFPQKTAIDDIPEEIPMSAMRGRAASNEMQVDDPAGFVSRGTVAGAGGSYSGAGGSYSGAGGSYSGAGGSYPRGPTASYYQASSTIMDTTTPAINYTTHRGPSQGTQYKAAANAALCYRNYADASATSASRQHQSTTGQSNYDNGIDNNTYQQQYAGYIEQDRDIATSRSHQTDRASTRNSQHTSLPKESGYVMPLSDDADIYSKNGDVALVGKPHTEIHPLQPSRTQYSSSTNRDNVSTNRDNVSTAPIPRGHPSRVPASTSNQMSRYPPTGSSARRLAEHDVKHPPTEDDDFLRHAAPVSLSPGALSSGTRI